MKTMRLAILMLFMPFALWAAEFDAFLGTYTGQAEVEVDGKTERRDMSVTIGEADEGFVVEWSSVIYKADGRTKEGTYTINFTPSPRENIFASAMKTNVFGKAVPLDPLNGEPFVWARLEGDTLSVYSLFINEVGEYEIQEYHRSLAEGGLDLVFRRVRHAESEREIRTFLKKQN